VIGGFQKAKYKLQGFDAIIDSNVPFGGGLSSSAALEVAAASLLELMAGKALDPIEKALLCQKAEHDFAGVPCGIMDQLLPSWRGKTMRCCWTAAHELPPPSDERSHGHRNDHQHECPPHTRRW